MEDNTNYTNKKLQAFYRLKDQKFDKFFDNLTLEYKMLKKTTHECQMNCFAKSESTRKQAEGCARKCLDPYLYVRKSIGDKLSDCDQKFQQQESKCLNDQNNLEICYQGLIEKLGICLQSNLGYAQKQYQSVFNDM